VGRRTVGLNVGAKSERMGIDIRSKEGVEGSAWVEICVGAEGWRLLLRH